jgi:hypothetical protein
VISTDRLQARFTAQFGHTRIEVRDVRIARTNRPIDRTVPIDGFDMFMLSRCEEPIRLAQLVEIVPCEATETMERIYKLSQLGLVSLLPDSSRAAPFQPRVDRTAQQDALTQSSVRPVAEPGDEVLDDADTLRPPAPPWKQRRDAAEDTRTSPVKGRAPTGFEVDPQPTTGVRARLMAFAPRPRRHAR